MVQRLIDRALPWIAVVVLLAGCATTPSYPSRPPPPPPQTVPPSAPSMPGQPAPTYPDQPPAPPSTATPTRPDPSVSLALREESLQAASRGDTAQAIALIERAIRIEPDRPELWLDLAKLHLEEGDYASAEQFARKALLYTRNHPELEQQAYVVISDAQRRR